MNINVVLDYLIHDDVAKYCQLCSIKMKICNEEAQIYNESAHYRLFVYFEKWKNLSVNSVVDSQFPGYEMILDCKKNVFETLLHGRNTNKISNFNLITVTVNTQH